jgi:prepilin-type N-terminal cleavage/methylation domain-containing protein
MMIQYRQRIFNRNQKGFTLVELLIAITITAVISTAVATASYQIFKVNARSLNRQIAIAQVQNGSNAVNRDAQQAQNIIPRYNNLTSKPVSSNIIQFDLVNDSAGIPLNTPDQLEIDWVAWDVATQHNTTHKVIYSVVNKVLQKTVTLTVDNGSPTTSTAVVANYVTSASGNWNTYTNTLTLIVQVDVPNATAGNKATENRTLQIIPRPAQ